DYPAYLLIFAISFAVRNFTQKDLGNLEKVKKTIIPSIVMFAAGIIAYLPYFMAFKQKREVKLVSFSRSLFSDFFEIFGTYITITILLMFLALFMMKKERGDKPYLMFSLLIFSSAIIVFQEITYLYLTAYILFGLFIILKLLFPGSQESAFGGYKTSGKEQEDTGVEKGVSIKKSLIYIIAIAILAATYGLWCEFFFVKDHYGGDLERMNTIFKVYLQMWFIWSFAASYGVYIVSSKLLSEKKLGFKIAWFAVVFTFIGMGIVYPISSTYVRCGRFNIESTLEGLKRAERIHSQDYKAIKWMEENVEGLPVILEACANAYEWASRFATFAGFPTVLGWANHEAGWRNDWETVNKRWNDINLAYQTTDITQTMGIFDKYNVQYVIVGTLERKNYSAASLSKFKDFMDIVYDRDGVRIYKRK
ncbi:hypothetical protein KKB18_13265, partial [bacterium]|nr:hypothetical protein [bacterium]